ncbi:MAG: recombinase family protein, partial [Rhodospirillaceae bacterium]|nr:recombinase family protein [Rhodospirillaceae bacterium]
RMIFERFTKVGSATVLAGALAAEGVLTKRGRPFSKKDVYRVLTNRVYTRPCGRVGSIPARTGKPHAATG